MNQRFDGPVEQVAAGDIHNYLPIVSRSLTKAERGGLNKLVRQLEEEFGEPGWKTWKFLHRTIGVDGVDAMRLEHRDSAEELLSLLLRCAQLQDGINAYANERANGAEFSDEAMRYEAEIKKVNRVAMQMIRRAELEKARSDSLAEDLQQARQENNRMEKILTRSYDELSLAKKEVERFRKRLNRIKMGATLFSLATLVGMFLVARLAWS